MNSVLYAIEAYSLSKVYPRRGQPPVRAVSDVSLAIPQGQIFGLLGANGAGKTTTIKILCGLVIPSSGTVTIAGHMLHTARGAALAQVGAVLEGARNVYWQLSAWENVLYFGRLKGLRGAILRERAADLLAAMNLYDRRRDPVGRFSRGMQQKVAIACALAADPPVLLLDEPTLGLDVHAARAIQGLLVELAYEQGKTIVLTTHQLAIAQEICERIAIIRAGELLTDQPTDQLLGAFREDYYEIRIAGRVSVADGENWHGLRVEWAEDHTCLKGPVADSEALYGVLGHLRDLKLPLVAVSRAEPTLEDVFIRLSE
jgi:ABC-2 type transport system ATP-binding protein